MAGCTGLGSGSMYKTKAGFVVHRPDGHAVAHPGISDVPYTASVEAWATTMFAGCTYIQRDCDGIAAMDLTVPGVIAVQAPKGAGKSKAIRASVKALSDATTAVQITFRRTLAWTSSREIMGDRASLYSDIHGTIRASEYPRHTIVVNSVARLQGPYDVVIIDELVAVMDALASYLLSGPGRVAAVHALSQLLASATTVVVADAMLDAQCVAFVLTARCASTASLTLYDYVRRVHEDYVFYAHENSGTWHAGLDAALRAGKRVVVPCMTKSMAKALEARYTRTYKTQCYTAETDPLVVEAHMTDIHKHWAKAQLLVYSPVVTAGCSFELKHFDVAFFYGFTGMGSVRNAIQMIARVRDIAEKTVHVFIDRVSTFGVPSAVVGRIEGMGVGMASDDVTTSSPCLTLMTMLHTYRRTEDVQARLAFSYCFWSLVRHSGAAIRFLQDGLVDAVPAEWRRVEVAPAAVARGDAGAAPPFSRREHFAVHDWDGYETGLDVHSRTDAVAWHDSRDPPLQRVDAVNPDHVLDVGCATFSGVQLHVGDDDDGLAFPSWCQAQEVEPRMRAWCRLVAQRAVLGTEGSFCDRLHIPRTKPVKRTVVMFRTAASYTTTWSPDGIRDAALVSTRPFFSVSTPCEDPEALQAAWVLAGMEMAFRSGRPATVGILDVMPVCVELAAAVAVRMCRITRYAAWVGVNVPMPCQTGVVDYLYMDYDGCFHAVTVRMSGDVVANARMDLLKTQVLVAALTAVPVATVRVLYLRTDESVVMNTTGWDASPLRNALSVTGLPAWRVADAVVYATCDAVGVGMEVYFPSDNSHVHASTTDALWSLVGPRRRLVSWNYTLFSDGDDRFDDRVFDIALALGKRLQNAHGDDALQVRCAHVLDGRADDEQHVGHPARRVERLYQGMITTGLLVYISTMGGPEGVSARCVPSVAFMTQYFGMH